MILLPAGLAIPKKVSASGHLYWRIAVTAVTSGSNPNVNELEFRLTSGGADQTSGGTAIESAHLSSFVPARAFDNNSTTCWVAAGASPWWIGYQFASPVSIHEIALTAYVTGDGGTSAQSPKDFTIDYSDNGSSWTTASTVTGQVSWTSAQQRLFSF